VATIAQIGPPPSVAALRQRLGRSGRRGEPSILRIYIEEPDPEPDSPPQDHLRAALVQTVAMVQLLMAKWCEPPEAGALHLSTLVQQVLSLIAQYGGARAGEAWRVLCRDGAFREVDERVFIMLLRELGRRDLLVQSAEGTLLLGVRGERLVNHYSFYTAFVTPEEYHLVAGGRELGTLPVSHPLSPGGFLIFAGQRWHILAVEAEAKIVQLESAPAGRAPRFDGTSAHVHERVRQEMRAVYESTAMPALLSTPRRGRSCRKAATPTPAISWCAPRSSKMPAKSRSSAGAATACWTRCSSSSRPAASAPNATASRSWSMA
jgi:ATP-dependent Lhr-like helicase